jgi:hypothetical protein
MRFFASASVSIFAALRPPLASLQACAWTPEEFSHEPVVVFARET